MSRFLMSLAARFPLALLHAELAARGRRLPTLAGAELAQEMVEVRRIVERITALSG